VDSTGVLTMTRNELGGRMVALIPTAKERAVRGAELAATGKAHHLVGSIWLVNGSGDDYIVDLAAGTCDCPDGRAPHDANGVKHCKHMCAVLLSQ